jgi:H+/Cl- antiporter ClcA
MCIGVAIAAIAAALADPYESALALVAFVVVLAVVVCFLFTATIVFFNWPSFTVPPPFRAEQGAAQSWLRWGRRRLGRRKGS